MLKKTAPMVSLSLTKTIYNPRITISIVVGLAPQESCAGYRLFLLTKTGVKGTAAWALAKPAAPPSVVQAPSTPASDEGRHGICLAKWGSTPRYRLITGPTRIRTRTCFRLFFEGVLIDYSSVFTLTIGGVSTTSKPVVVPPIKFKPRRTEAYIFDR